MRRALGSLAALILLFALFRVSRFWTFGLDGGLWRRWMGELGLGVYDVPLWALAGFALLTVAQKLWSRFGGH